MKYTLNAAMLMLALTPQLSFAANTVTSTFDDLTLAPESYYDPKSSTNFTSGLATFQHNYSDMYGSWDGFIYSNTTDITTAGYLNQQSAYTGGGVDGSANYGLAYVAGNTGISFTDASVVSGAYFTNTTFAALSMRDGDQFAKKFGGPTGNDEDYFKLTITGINANGKTSGSVDFFLADYRFADNSKDYIVNTWSFVDLSALGAVKSLQFTMDSSDSSQFDGITYINTPAYFAIDNLVVAAVPEPASYALMLAGLSILGFVARRRKL